MKENKLFKAFVSKFVPSDTLYAQGLKLKNAAFVEIVGGDLYFVSQNKLFCVQNYAEFDGESLLNEVASAVQTLGGKVLSLFRLENRLFYTAAVDSGFCLYAVEIKFTDENFANKGANITANAAKPANETNFANKIKADKPTKHAQISKMDYPNLEEFIQLGQKEALLLFHSANKGTSAVFYLNHDKFTLLSDEGSKIYSIALKGAFLYANIAQKEIKAIAKKDFSGGFVKINSQNFIKSENKIFKLVNFDDKILLAPDIRTSKIVDESGKIAFEAKNDSAQINSFIYTKTPFNRLYAVFSAWRNKNAPRSRVFVTRNDFKLLLSKTDSLAYADEFKWTGFHCYKSGFVKWGESVIFTNVFEYPLVVHFGSKFSPFGEKSAFNKISPATFKMSFKDDKSVVFESLPLQENAAQNFANPQATAQAQNFTATTQTAQMQNSAQAPKSPAKPSFYRDFSPLKKTKFVISIDVEQHIKNPKAFAITGEGLNPECGIYLIMDILERHGLKGVFFVNIYEHKNHENALIEKIIKDIDQRGHEVGLHYHKNENSLFDKELPTYSLEGQIKALKYGKDFIENITKKPCISFRGGGYFINENSLKALESVGFLYDSSVFSQSKQLLHYKNINKIAKYGKITEFPISTLYDEYIRKIDINVQANAARMLGSMLALRKAGLSFITTMLHSFSFVKFDKGDGKSKLSELKFTGNRYAVGVNERLIKEFEHFCQAAASSQEFECTTFADLKQGEIEDILRDNDVLPKAPLNFYAKTFCPICQQETSFEPYRKRANALCPKCRSLERMRLKWLYLERVLKIHSCKPLNILHIGPAMCVYDRLKEFSQHFYITSDPFSPSIYKYPLENLPFENGFFDLIIAIEILQHTLDDEACIKEMARLISKRGQIIISVGGISEEKTTEYYNRKDFSRMVASEFSYPQDLSAGKTFELPDGKLGYNPRFATRRYGKDIIQKLAAFGLQAKIFEASNIANFKNYGVKNDVLIIASKDEITAWEGINE